MRLMTKAILVLSIVVLCVVLFWLASNDSATTDAEEGGSEIADRTARRRPERSTGDSIVSWIRDRADEATEDVDVNSSAEDEGPAVASRGQETLGADPPGPVGPVLRPTAIEGRVVDERWGTRRRRERRDNTRYYEITSGDTLSGISREYFGDASGVRLIQAANPGLDPRALPVGRRIVIPKPESERPAEQPERPNHIYVVRRNDTLVGIAKRFYGDAAAYKDIYRANRDVLSSANATLYPGQRLRLPDAE